MTKVRYVASARPHRAWWDDLYQLDRNPTGLDRLQVIELDTEPRPTGLLDPHGNPLFRVEEKQPIGFVPLREV